MAQMTTDMIVAATTFGAWLISATNTYALIVDGDAKGVRPYSSMYLAASNSFLTYQLVSLEQAVTAVVSVLFVLLNIVNASLIIRYQGFAPWPK